MSGHGHKRSASLQAEGRRVVRRIERELKQEPTSDDASPNTACTGHKPRASSSELGSNTAGGSMSVTRASNDLLSARKLEACIGAVIAFEPEDPVYNEMAERLVRHACVSPESAEEVLATLRDREAERAIFDRITAAVTEAECLRQVHSFAKAVPNAQALQKALETLFDSLSPATVAGSASFLGKLAAKLASKSINAGQEGLVSPPLSQSSSMASQSHSEPMHEDDRQTNSSRCSMRRSIADSSSPRPLHRHPKVEDQHNDIEHRTRPNRTPTGPRHGTQAETLGTGRTDLMQASLIPHVKNSAKAHQVMYTINAPNAPNIHKTTGQEILHAYEEQFGEGVARAASCLSDRAWMISFESQWYAAEAQKRSIILQGHETTAEYVHNKPPKFFIWDALKVIVQPEEVRKRVLGAFEGSGMDLEVYHQHCPKLFAGQQFVVKFKSQPGLFSFFVPLMVMEDGVARVRTAWFGALNRRADCLLC